MDISWWVLFFCAVATIFFAARIVRMPDINSDSLQTRLEWPLPPQSAHLRAECLKIAKSFRWDLGDNTTKLFGRTLLGLAFLASGLMAFDAMRSGDLGSAAREVWKFMLSEVGLGLLFPTVDSDLLQRGTTLYSIVSFALDLLLGSWLIYLLAFGWSWIVSRLFPVRWVKWAKINKTTGRHNRAWRNRRRLAVLWDSTQRVTPRSGDEGYGVYEARGLI